jgi:hypothetical protein
MMALPGRRVLRATGVVLAIRLALWCLPYAVVMRYLTSRREGLRRRRPVPTADPSHIAWRVAVASRFVPRSTCLVQALSGQQLLAAAGHDSTVHFGVALNASSRLGAHAWLACDDRIVIGGSAEQFAVFGSSAPDGKMGDAPGERP